MTVEFVCVGTEILLGNIVNTNAAYLAEQCAMLGLSCYHQSVVGDNEERMEEVIRQAVSRSDIVILSGGLGPTRDDLTKEVTAKVFGMELVEDPHSRSRIEAYFQKSGRQITENNWKQAMVPKGAIVVDNDNGTAPGLILCKDGKRAVLLPGPPNELIPMFEKDIRPYLNQLEPEGIYSKMVKICGSGESKVESLITDLLEKQTNPTIAPYAKNRGSTSSDHCKSGGRRESRSTDEAGDRGTVPKIRQTDLYDRGRGNAGRNGGVASERAASDCDDGGILQRRPDGGTAAECTRCVGSLQGRIYHLFQ